MNSRINHYQFFFLLCLAFSLGSCNKSPVGKLIIVQVPSGIYQANSLTGEKWRYLSGAQIALLDPDQPKRVKLLTKDFYSACSPDISPDGKLMLFAAQLKENDLWQIWEMDIRSQKYHRIVEFEGNCTDPVFLPINKIVFTANSSKADSNIYSGYQMYVCKNDGGGLQQITFHPHSDFASTVMKDGRLLTTTRQLYPFTDERMLMAIRPDGTKASLFYKGSKGTFVIARPRETNGLIYIIESDSNMNTSVISISYNRPLHSRKKVNVSMKGDFSSVFPTENGELLVTYKNTNARFEVFSLHNTDGKLGNRIYGRDGYDVIDVMQIFEYNRPKSLPSEVDMGVKTGLLLCQNVNFTGIENKDSEAEMATKIEVMGLDSIMGIVRVDKDGSFYLKVIADKPFKIFALDEYNNVINSTSWIWLRPNERRGFTGCRQDYEMAPLNQVSIAIKKDPVIIPMSVTEIHEKEVELE